MQLKGKIFTGIIFLFLGDLTGLPLGGLIGFLFGAVVGHYGVDLPRSRRTERVFKAYERRKGEFIYHVFSLCAKVAKADGAITRSEINFMERLMRQQFRLSDAARGKAIKVWKDAKESPRSFDDFARAFYNDFAKERSRVLDMMHLLFETAAADGNLHPREEQILLRAAGIFHVSRLQYDRIKSRFYHDPAAAASPKWRSTDPHYAILGAEAHEPLDVIKKKYRELAKKWHPDKLMAAGASPEALRHAKEKFQQINEAWERILASRKT